MEAFVDTAELAATTWRVYGASLIAFTHGAGEERALEDLRPPTVASWFAERDQDVAPVTWNRELATLRSAVGWWAKQNWLGADPTVTIERRPEHPDRTRALTRRQVESLWYRPDVGLREKALWRLLYETAARANEILGLDVDDLDLGSKRARVRSKGGAVEWVLFGRPDPRSSCPASSLDATPARYSWPGGCVPGPQQPLTWTPRQAGPASLTGAPR